MSVSDIPAGDGNIEKLFLRCKCSGPEEAGIWWTRGHGGTVSRAPTGCLGSGLIRIETRTVPEIIDQVFVETSPIRSFSMTENERFGLVFTKTRVYKFGHREYYAAVLRKLSCAHFDLKYLIFNICTRIHCTIHTCAWYGLPVGDVGLIAGMDVTEVGISFYFKETTTFSGFFSSIFVGIFSANLVPKNYKISLQFKY